MWQIDKYVSCDFKYIYPCLKTHEAAYFLNFQELSFINVCNKILDAGSVMYCPAVAAIYVQWFSLFQS